MASKSEITEHGATLFAATVSHPMLHVLGKTEIKELRLVSPSDLKNDDVISYRTSSGIWHMGFIRKVGGTLRLEHNYPGKNVSIDYLDDPDLEISDHVYRLVFRKPPIAGVETRLKATRLWIYDQITENCESFIRFVMYGNSTSWSVENGLNITLHVSSLLIRGASNVAKTVMSK